MHLHSGLVPDLHGQAGHGAEEGAGPHIGAEGSPLRSVEGSHHRLVVREVCSRIVALPDISGEVLQD